MPMNHRLMRPLAGVPSGTPASLLLKFDDANGSTSFVDSSPNGLTVTAYGGAEIGTAQNKWGGASMYVADSANDGVTFHADATDQFQFVGDYTVEFWLYRVSGADDTSLYLTYDGSNYHAINIDGSNFNLYFNSASPDAVIAHSIGLDAWAHVAVVRSGDQVTLYVDGVSIGSATSSVTHGYATPTLARTGGGNIGSEMYIDDLRVVRGLAVYTGPFVPPSAPLSPYAKQVAVSRQASLLLHMDGTNGSTTFTDSSVNALSLTAEGTAEISTAESKFGGASAYFDGDAFISIEPSETLEPGGSDFTLEFWWYPTNEDRQWIYHTETDFWFGIDYLYGCMGMWASSEGTGWDIIESDSSFGRGSIVVPQNQWNHIAYTRQGNYWRLFVNGMLDKTIESSASIVNKSAEYKNVGGWAGGDPSGAPRVQGYIDDFRFVTGLAVYTGPFVPPTGPLPAIATPQPIQAQASLLLHFDGADGSTTFTDSSQNALTVTANGDAEISTAQSKWGGASGYFDGDGDYASVAGCDELASSWTVECWLHTPALAGTRAVVSKGAASDVSNCWSVEPDGNALGLYADIGNGIEIIATSPEVPVDEWVHLAVVSNNGVVTLFVNGSGGSPSSQVSIASTLGADLIVGAGWYDPASRGFEGYIDDLRIVKGLAVYTGNFTPPTGPLGATVTPQ